MPVEDTSLEKPASLAKLATLPEVTGIRHWSSADSSTVVIDLQDQVQYEAHRLTGPERIYFDLPDTRLAPELFGKNFEIGDPLIQRVRVAQPVAGVTRVVLETKGASNFSVSLEINPYRLVVEIRKVGTKPEAKSKMELFAPDQSPVAGNTPASPLAPKLRIVLDAGHGGWDLGTVGRAGLLEKDLALDIVRRLGNLAERRLGAQVVYTRKDDSYVALEKRTEIANLSGADLFLSIHANYSDYPSARGVETYYTNTYSSVKARPENDQTEPGLQNINWTNVDIREKVRESHRLAASIQHALYATLARKNPGLPNRGVKEAQYVVLTGTTMPAVLAEISFVSSPTDENNLQSANYRQQIAEALYRGVAHYAAEFHRVNLAKSEKQAER
jgi:N-acetylmuramoyl-L-alanine amidase